MALEFDKFFLVNSDNEHAVSLAKKMAKEAKPGALVLCTDNELRAYEDKEILSININDSNNIPIAKVSSGESYILFCNDKVDIDNLFQVAEELRIQIGIVRVD